MKPDATSASETERSPLDKALDVGVFAPLGFALEFRRLVPELAEAGRQQVAFSRSLGKAALSTLGKAAAAQARSSAPAAADTPKATEPKPTKATPTKARPAKPKPTKPTPAKAAKKSGSSHAKGSGQVEGYDGLTAREIVALAAAATAPQRAWMLDREQAGKQRKTVLKALDGS